MFTLANLLRGLALAVGVMLCYFIPNQFNWLTAHEVPITSVDQWVPLSPPWAWAYVSYYPLLIAAYFVTTGTTARRFYVFAMSIAAGLGFFIFFFLPTSIPRELYPLVASADGTFDLSTALLAHVRGADKSLNCLPSMHVAMSFLAAVAISRVTGRLSQLSVWILFAAIVYSTMATKQHYFLDLVAGLALGLVVIFASDTYLKRRPQLR